MAEGSGDTGSLIPECSATLIRCTAAAGKEKHIVVSVLSEPQPPQPPGSNRCVKVFFFTSWRDPWRLMASVSQSGGGSAVCVCGGDTSSRRWLRSWPRFSTTKPHETDEGQDPGGGSRGELHGDGMGASSSPAGALQHVRRACRCAARGTAARAVSARGAGRGLQILDALVLQVGASILVEGYMWTIERCEDS